MIKFFIVFFLGVCINPPNGINTVSKEEAFSPMASSFLLQRSDSIYLQEYKLVKKLYKNKDYPKALDMALRLLETTEKKNLPNVELLTNYLIGDIFRKVKNYPKAKTYYRRACKLYNQQATQNKEWNTTTKIKEYSSLENFFKLGGVYLRLKNIDSAKYYYDKIINTNLLSKEFLSLQSKTYSNLSNIYFSPGKYQNFKLAETYALKAINIDKRTGDKIAEANSTATLASVYLSLGKFNKAKKYYLQAIAIIEHNNNNKALSFKEVFYDNLSWAMYQQKDYKAYDFLGKSYDLRDTLRDIETRKILAQIEANHELENLKKEEEIKRLKIKRNIWTLGVVIALLIVGILFLVNFYKLRQRNLKLELTRSDLLQQKKLEKIRSEVHTRILNATIDGKETERKQIAEILHDNVSTMLSSANLHIKASKHKFKKNAPEEILKAEKIIKEASGKIRDLSHTLVSSILLKFGLEFALKDMSEKYSNSKLQIQSRFKNIRRYHLSFEIKMYNIIQELINNFLKHSQAENAFVSLEEKDNYLIVKVQDDGEGFDTETVFNKDKVGLDQKDGLGINQIEARIQMLKGEFKIVSSKGKGTKVYIKVPIKEKD